MNAIRCPRPAALLRCLLAVVLAFAAAAAWTQEKKGPPEIQWPRVNLSTCYQVDAGFFHRPDGLEWRDLTGIAIDRQGQIWLATRAENPVRRATSCERGARG